MNNKIKYLKTLLKGSMKDKIRLPAEWEKQQAVILAIPHKQSDWKNYLQDSIKKVCQIASNIAQ